MMKRPLEESIFWDSHHEGNNTLKTTCLKEYRFIFITDLYISGIHLQMSSIVAFLYRNVYPHTHTHPHTHTPSMNRTVQLSCVPCTSRHSECVRICADVRLLARVRVSLKFPLLPQCHQIDVRHLAVSLSVVMLQIYLCGLFCVSFSLCSFFCSCFEFCPAALTHFYYMCVLLCCLSLCVCVCLCVHLCVCVCC